MRTPQKAVDGSAPEKALDGNDSTREGHAWMHGCMDGNTSEKALDMNGNMAQKGFDPRKTTKNTLGGNNKKTLMKQERLFRDTTYTNQLEIEKRPIDIKANQARSHENVCVGQLCDIIKIFYQ